MERFLGQISILVKDYDEALDFYINVLGFQLVEDTILSPDKRWVVIKPSNTKGQGCNLLLAKASNSTQEMFIGNQTGGRVFLFLYTDDFNRDYDLLINNGVKIVRNPSEESYGRVLVFSDLYGNLWDLIEPILRSFRMINFTFKITDMNQFLNDLKALVKTHWKTIFIIVLAIYLFTNYTDIKSGIMDAWSGK